MSKNSKPVKSAGAVAALRAASSVHPDPTVRNPDFLAKHFPSGIHRALLRLPHAWLRRVVERMVPGGYCYFLARTRFVDALFKQAIEDGIEQFVILGAGFDSRAHRFRNQLASATVFEIDLPAMQEAKLSALRRAEVSLNERVVYGTDDFQDGALGNTLEAMDFDFSKRSLFVLEGVSYYLEQSHVSKMLELVAKRCGSGSAFVFDYSLKSFLDGDYSTYGSAEMAKWLERNNEPFRFGLEPSHFSDFVESCGLEVRKNMRTNEIADRYLRDSQGEVIGKPLGYLCFAHCVKS
ncbi:MAG: SAM-dependent methyltransferase [Gammaproteobacteria bacterium]|nr:SAM-dependent methyltransferase [Gammaproteobacteria bacterium]